MSFTLQEFPQPDAVTRPPTKTMHYADEPRRTLCGLEGDLEPVEDEIDHAPFVCKKCGPAIHSDARIHRLVH